MNAAATPPRRRVTPIGVATLVVLALAAWLATGVYTVPASSVGVERFLGRVSNAGAPPGVHWWWPWPVGAADRVEVTTSLTATIGFSAPDQPQERPSGFSAGRWLTGDTNILELRAKVTVRISDPAAWLFSGEDPVTLLQRVVGAVLTEATSATPVDDLLTSGRLALVARVRTRAQELLDTLGTGLQILSIDVQSIEPPANVIAAFQDVQNARADRARSISDAESYRNSLLPVARGEADGRVQESSSFRERRLNEARGRADAFGRLVEEHRRNPDLLEQRLYLETLEKVLPRVKRYVLTPAGPGSPAIRVIE